MPASFGSTPVHVGMLAATTTTARAKATNHIQKRFGDLVSVFLALALHALLVLFYLAFPLEKRQATSLKHCRERYPQCNSQSVRLRCWLR
mmetsp:Transcript_98715/g.283641  ORF Transcript_98715/g.283641 Transcript_98715/m.283641 type:complete len:90 (+) Transcript_98715:488-757(+)